MYYHGTCIYDVAHVIYSTEEKRYNSTEIAKTFYCGFHLFVLINQKFSLAMLRTNWAKVQLGQRHKIPCYKTIYSYS